MTYPDPAALKGSSISRLVEARSARTPDAIALTAPGRPHLTYGRLQMEIASGAQRLRTLGIGRDDRVVIIVPSGPEMALAFLTVAACAAAAPLNPSYGSADFDFYLPYLKPKALLIQSGSNSPAVSVAEKYKVPLLELSPVAEGPAGLFTIDAETGFVGEKSIVESDVALLLPTSGTTARPKIVPLTHENLCTSARNIKQTLKLSKEDRCLNIMPLFHIHGLVGALLSTLAAGGTFVCPGEFDATKFFSWLEEFRPSWYTGVPTMHQAILAAGHTRFPGRPSLRFIRSCSAPLPPTVAEHLEAFFRVPVIESYGMTEAAHQITSNPLPPRSRKRGSVGVAAGPEVSVLGEKGTPLPQGVTGEIVLRGGNVIESYWNEPELDEMSFTQGWLRTGDAGYLDRDGYLFITGRLKEMINRGGEKIAPREIEEALLNHSDVIQAMAFAVPHPSLGEDIAAAIVLRKNSSVSEAAVREYLLERIAGFKVPATVLIVDEIPTGATGKIQRAELARRFLAEINSDFVPPRTKLEEIVAAIYSEVLGLVRAGAHSNFFSAGGDSLRATQVIARLRAILEVNLSMATLFRRATVAELAAEIAALLENTDSSTAQEILAEISNLSEEAAETLLTIELTATTQKSKQSARCS